MRDWVKLNRGTLDCEWYRDANTLRLFVHLLLVSDDNGTLTTSIRRLARDLNISVQNVRTSLEKLVVTHKVTQRSTHKVTQISVCGIADYKESQHSNQHSGQHSDQHTKEENPPAPPKEENTLFIKKKLSKESKKESVSSTPEPARPIPPPPSLDLPYKSRRFAETWETLRRQPKWKGKTMYALQLSLNRLGRYDEAFAIELMETAIERNYQGVVFSSTDADYRKWKEGRGGRLESYMETARRLGLIHDGSGQGDTVDEQ